mmetsp:Transcript_4413/g.10236  ORF Transcript_4413/g.10236 Transcript_4413/m.10236 type:complete len:519 (+) Transcript_4413:67-1623(+)
MVLLKLLTTLALAFADQAEQQEIDMLVRADQQLMQQVKEIRQILNVKLPDDLQALVGRSDWNRQAIIQVARLTQGELEVASAKIAGLQQELGKVKAVALGAFPQAASSIEAQLAEEDRKIDQLSGVSQAELHHQDMRVNETVRQTFAQAAAAIGTVQREAQADARETGELQKVANWLEDEFKRQDAQLKTFISRTDRTQSLLKEEDAELERKVLESRRKVANVTQLVQAKLGVQQQLVEFEQQLKAVALASQEKDQRNQEQVQLLQNRLDDMTARLETFPEVASGYSQLNQTLADVVFEQRVNFWFVLPSFIIGMSGILALFCLRFFEDQPRRYPARITPVPALAEPLLAAPTLSTSSRANSEISFSVVTPCAGTVPQAAVFLPRAILSSTEGTLEVESLRPKAVVRSALGNPMEVQIVTFKHVDELQVVDLAVATGSPVLTVAAAHRFFLHGRTDQAVTAMTLAAGDMIVLRGAAAEVLSVHERTLRHVNIVEVEFNVREPVETLVDAGEQLSFHLV